MRTGAEQSRASVRNDLLLIRGEARRSPLERPAPRGKQHHAGDRFCVWDGAGARERNGDEAQLRDDAALTRRRERTGSRARSESVLPSPPSRRRLVRRRLDRKYEERVRDPPIGSVLLAVRAGAARCSSWRQSGGELPPRSWSRESPRAGSSRRPKEFEASIQPRSLTRAASGLASLRPARAPIDRAWGPRRLTKTACQRWSTASAVSSCSALSAACASQADGLRGGSRTARWMASRAVEASDQSARPLRRASQNHVHARRWWSPCISWRTTSTCARGVFTITVADRLRTPPGTRMQPSPNVHPDDPSVRGAPPKPHDGLNPQQSPDWPRRRYRRSTCPWPSAPDCAAGRRCWRHRRVEGSMARRLGRRRAPLTECAVCGTCTCRARR